MSVIRWIDPRNGVEMELVHESGCAGCSYQYTFCPDERADLSEAAPPCGDRVWRPVAQGLTDLDRELLASLKGMATMYCDLVEGSDAGYWNPEDEPEVKAARAAIAKAEGKDSA